MKESLKISINVAINNETNFVDKVSLLMDWEDFLQLCSNPEYQDTLFQEVKDKIISEYSVASFCDTQGKAYETKYQN